MLSLSCCEICTLILIAAISCAGAIETDFPPLKRTDSEDYVRLSDPDLYYAAESRNYPEDPDTLFVTMRGGGVKVFDISEPAQLKAVSQWHTDRAVEGQDRVGDLMVVAELGRG